MRLPLRLRLTLSNQSIIKTAVDIFCRFVMSQEFARCIHAVFSSLWCIFRLSESVFVYLCVIYPVAFCACETALYELQGTLPCRGVIEDLLPLLE